MHHGILGDRDEAEIADYDVARHGAELRITADRPGPGGLTPRPASRPEPAAGYRWDP